MFNCKRKSDTVFQAVFRTWRYFNDNRGWWVMTRESIPLGPYKTESLAEDGLNEFILRVQEDEVYGALKLALKNLCAKNTVKPKLTALV